MVLVVVMMYSLVQGEYFSMRCQISATYDDWPQAICKHARVRGLTWPWRVRGCTGAGDVHHTYK